MALTASSSFQALTVTPATLTVVLTLAVTGLVARHPSCAGQARGLQEV